MNFFNRLLYYMSTPSNLCWCFCADGVAKTLWIGVKNVARCQATVINCGWQVVPCLYQLTPPLCVLHLHTLQNTTALPLGLNNMRKSNCFGRQMSHSQSADVFLTGEDRPFNTLMFVTREPSCVCCVKGREIAWFQLFHYLQCFMRYWMCISFEKL